MVLHLHNGSFPCAKLNAAKFNAGVNFSQIMTRTSPVTCLPSYIVGEVCGRAGRNIICLKPSLVFLCLTCT